MYTALGICLENHCQSPILKTKMSLDNALASLPTTMMFWTGVPSHWDSPDSIGNSLLWLEIGILCSMYVFW